MLLLLWKGEAAELPTVTASGSSTATLSLGLRQSLQPVADGRGHADPIESAALRGVAPDAQGVSTTVLTLEQDHGLGLLAAGVCDAELALRTLVATLVVADGYAEAVARSLRHPIPARLVTEVLQPLIQTSAPASA